MLSLPGPRIHLDRIAADLAAGRHCIWLVPDTLVRSGAAGELLHDLADRLDAVWPVPPSVMPPTRTRHPATHPAGSTAVWDQSVPKPDWVDREPDLVTWRRPGRPQPVEAVAIAPPPATIGGRVLAALHGADDDAVGSVADPVAALAADSQLNGRVIVVPAWEENDPDAVAALFTQLVATVKGRPAASRPRMLVAARIDDLLDTTLNRLDVLESRVHWWWGCTTQPDTAVTIALSRPAEPRAVGADHAHAIRELVAVDVAAAVAGPDLELARWLAVRWDGRCATLAATVQSFIADGHTDPTPVTWRERGRYWSAPPQELRADWASGKVDSWGGQIMISPCGLTPEAREAELQQRLWRGQHRALTPIIDEYRSMVEQVVHSRLSMRDLATIATDRRNSRPAINGFRGPPLLEIGQMRWAVKDRLVRLPQQYRDLLEALYRIRNALAHHCPVTDGDIDELITAASRLGSR